MAARDQRKWDILQVLYCQEFPLPATNLLRFAGLKRTPYAMELLQELVEDGWLQVQPGELNNGLAVRLYSLTSAGRDALQQEL